MDGTPPIFLSPEQRVEGDKIVLIFTVSFTLFIVLFFLISYLEPPDRFRRSETEAQKLKKQTKRRDAAERFVVNFHWLSYNLLLPGYSRIFKSAEHIASWGFIVVWIISIILLAVGLETITSGAARNDRLIIAGLIVYFIAIIGYFISRVLVFYKDKLELRKLVKFYPTGSVSLDRNGGLSQNGSADSDSLSTLSLTLDRNMNYRRRIKHISPVLSRVELSGFNAIQTLVIIVEFIQLASFPVRDLYRNDAFQLALQLPQGTFSKDFMALIRSALAIFSTGLPNVDFDYVKFVICWWLTIAAVCIAGIFIAGYYAIRSEWVLRKLDSMQKTKNFLTSVDATWILSFLPIVNLLYLVILNAFLERLGCLSSNITPTWPAPLEELGLAIQKRQSECLPIYSAYPMMHTAYSLVGFTLAFFIFTACRTAQEPKPEDGIINYTSNSELLLKSGAIIILLLYTLVPTSATATVRGSLAAIIISLMILYNVVIGSTYSRWINFLRTLSFLAVLWMSLVVTYYTAENQFLELYNTGSGVWNVVAIGWCVVWAVYSLLCYFVVMKWEDTCHKSSDMNSLPRSDKSEPFDAADQSSGEDNPRQINVIVENSKNSMGRNGKELRQNLSFTSLNSDIGSPGRYRAAGRPAPYSNDQRASLDKNSAGGTSDSSTNVNMTLI